jgi:hypothetical protein
MKNQRFGVIWAIVIGKILIFCLFLGKKKPIIFILTGCPAIANRKPDCNWEGVEK